MPRQKQPPLKMVAALVRQYIRTLTGVALLAILAGTLTLAKHWVSDPYRFPLDVVEVKGDFRHLDKQQLQKNCLRLLAAQQLFKIYSI